MTTDQKIQKIRLEKIAGKIIYTTALIVILALLFIRVDFICKMQTDSLNQIMDMRQEVDDLSEKIVLMDKDIQNAQKIALSEPQSLTAISTAYCACIECCGEYADGYTATGTLATEGRTIAVDPAVIPYGTKVFINGREYIAEDCGGSIKGNRIDIYFKSHEDALKYGRQTVEVIF